jgi:hypothetical protein
LHFNNNYGIEDVNNIAKNKNSQNKIDEKDATKEIEVLNKPKNEGFNLKFKDLNKKSESKNKPQKKRKFCSIL